MSVVLGWRRRGVRRVGRGAGPRVRRGGCPTART